MAKSVSKRNTNLPALLLALALSGSASAGDLLTVYRQAVDTNPQLAAAAADLRAVREKRPQGLAGLLPTLGLTGNIARQSFKNLNQSSPTSRSTSRSAGLQLSQPLFRYDRWIQLKQADSAIAQAEAQYAAAQQDLMVTVASRYFDVLGAEDKLEFALAEKKAIARQLDQARQRFDVGLIAVTDVNEAQARYDLSVSQEILARSQLQEARDALREVTGAHYEQLLRLQNELELVSPEPASPDEWVRRAMEQNLRVLAAQAGAETARQEIRRQRAGHLPTLDASASYSYLDTNFGGIAPITRMDGEVGVQLKLPIYQGGLVSSRTREARSRFEQATELLQQEVRAAELETRNAFRNVDTAIAQVKALAQSLRSTQVALEATEAGFEVGTRTIVDVLNAQREYHRAKLDHARARYLYLVNRLRLKKAAGILTTDDLTAINKHLQGANP